MDFLRFQLRIENDKKYGVPRVLEPDARNPLARAGILGNNSPLDLIAFAFPISLPYGVEAGLARAAEAEAEQTSRFIFRYFTGDSKGFTCECFVRYRCEFGPVHDGGESVQR